MRNCFPNRPWPFLAVIALLLASPAFGQPSDPAPAATKAPEDTGHAELPEVPRRQYPSFPLPTPAEARIEEALNALITVNWADKPLSEALDELEERDGIEIWIDKQALNDEQLDLDPTINLSLNAVSLRGCLQRILEPIGLTSVIEDEVLKITTDKKLNSRPVTRIYPISDFVDTAEDAAELLETIECGLGISRVGNGAPRMAVSARMKTLTVRESPRIQQKVQDLLLALRDAQPQLRPVVPVEERRPEGETHEPDRRKI
jgi:hypothetical protein